MRRPNMYIRKAKKTMVVRAKFYMRPWEDENREGVFDYDLDESGRVVMRDLYEESKEIRPGLVTGPGY